MSYPHLPEHIKMQLKKTTLKDSQSLKCLNEISLPAEVNCLRKINLTGSKIQTQTKDKLQTLLIALVVVDTYIQKHIHSKLDWEDTIQILLFRFRVLPGIHSKEGYILPTFWQRFSQPFQKTAFA